MISEPVTKALHRQFTEVYKKAPGKEASVFFCPGRVCLLGEHLDYNGGPVLPAAISLGIYALVQPVDNPQIEIASESFSGRAIFSLPASTATPPDGWGLYPWGVFKIAEKKGIKTTKGAKIILSSTLPAGAGLSSSAALEALTLQILSFLAEVTIPPMEAALWCRQAEVEEVGVSCGIMDQFAVIFGKKRHAIFLNCDTLDYQYVPCNPGRFAIVLMHTNQSRSLVHSPFNDRKRECESALEHLSKIANIQNLAQATEEMLHQIPNLVAAKRAAYVVSETKRVKQAVTLLQKEDWAAYADLMKQNHAALRDLYEVTGPHLDAITEVANAHPACPGSRMTGAGFGGCAYALVEKTEVTDFISFVEKRYEAKTGLRPSFFEVEI